MADEYNMVASLAYTSDVWLRSINSKLPWSVLRWKPNGLWMLILCALLFRKPQHFEDFTKTMILRAERIDGLMPNSIMANTQLSMVPCQSCEKLIKSSKGVARRGVEVMVKKVEGFCLGCIKDEVFEKGSWEDLHYTNCKFLEKLPQPAQ